MMAKTRYVGDIPDIPGFANVPQPGTPLSESLPVDRKGRLVVHGNLSPQQREASGRVMEGDQFTPGPGGRMEHTGLQNWQTGQAGGPGQQPGQPGPAQSGAADPDFYLKQKQTQRLNEQLRPYNAQLQAIEAKADEAKQVAKTARTKAEMRAESEYAKSKKDPEARQRDYDSAVQKAEYAYIDAVDTAKSGASIDSKPFEAQIDSISSEFGVGAGVELGTLIAYQSMIDKEPDAARRFELQKEQRQKLGLDYPIETPPELVRESYQEQLEDATKQLNSLDNTMAQG